MNLQRLKSNPRFRDLKPNEKYLLLIIYFSTDLRFTISSLSKLSDIHRQNLHCYVKTLADYDFIDLCLIGNLKEVLKK